MFTRHHLLFALSLAACVKEHAPGPPETGAPHTGDTAAADTATYTDEQPYNVMFIVWDDAGVESFELYPDAAETPVRTPVFDALAAEGLLFEHAWAYPVCSPTRASILTGRHPYRHGIGRVLHADDPKGLPYEEILLPEALDADPDADWSHAAIGKWHLGTTAQDSGLNPLEHGFDSHQGPLYNPESYFRWTKNVNGTTEMRSGYLTEDTVEDAKAAIDTLPEPWFMWVAFNAPHSPWHLPPEDSYYTKLATKDATSKYRAMLESADFYTGQLLDHMSPELRARTMIVVVGDNGTPQDVTGGVVPHNQAKTTVYEGGVRVPMVISGPAVTDPGRRTDALVQVTDLYPTALDWAGVSAPDTALDGKSLTPLLANQSTEHHDIVYTERSERLGSPELGHRFRAVRDARYKLVRIGNGVQFFDLSKHWLEKKDLLANQPLEPDAEAAYQRLSAALEAHVAP